MQIFWYQFNMFLNLLILSGLFGVFLLVVVVVVFLVYQGLENFEEIGLGKYTQK